MKKFLSVLVILGFGVMLFNSCEQNVAPEVQPQIGEYHSLGAELLPPGEYEKIPLAKTPVVDIKATTLTLNVPPVGNQGGEGSCVAWGTTYAARSINWQASHPASWSQSVNIFSPEYVYNQIKVRKPCSSGAYVTKGLDLLKSQGVCTWTTMPYTDVACKTLPTTAQKAEAALYKIPSYSRITINTSTIKSFLTAGKPVVVGGPVSNGYMYLANNAVLTTFVGASLGGHCYCIVGYDDTKGAFKFMNSWGTSWASQGFGWIAYGYETTWWTEAYVIN